MPRRGPDLLLVAMPWAVVETPSLQLGLIQAQLVEQGFACASRSFYLAWADWLAERLPGFHLDAYREMAEVWWTRSLGDWVFSGAPYVPPGPVDDQAYLAHLRATGVPSGVIEQAQAMRRLASGFVDELARQVLALDPCVVGFTTCFSQNIPSLALARALKAADPGIVVVFGGANCDGPMGAALFRTFPDIDVVVRGEAEGVLEPLLQDLLAGRSIRPQPGLCWREAGEPRIEPMRAGVQPLRPSPPPDFAEYFERLAASPFAAELGGLVRIPFESARGCWWGAKMHCTFCGLNGSSMAFRSRPAGSVLGEILTQAERYGVRTFEAVDNIIDHKYLRTLLPSLAEVKRAGLDLSLFYETKANLTRDQVWLMREAGLDRIQPGIESLSTPILRAMRKGITALQNIRLLKWATEAGLRINWNIIHGLPGESPEAYAEMARTMATLTHLRPPDTAPLRVHRFSPYFDQPEAFGLRLLGPRADIAMVYGASPEAVGDLAYEYDHEHLDGRDPAAYVGPVLDARDMWRAAHAAGASLTWAWTGDALRIEDRRPNLGFRTLTLGAVEAAIHQAIDGGATADQVWRTLDAPAGAQVSPREITGFLDALRDLNLVYEEDGVYLSLAIAAHPVAPSMAADRAPVGSALEAGIGAVVVGP